MNRSVENIQCRSMPLREPLLDILRYFFHPFGFSQVITSNFKHVAVYPIDVVKTRMQTIRTGCAPTTSNPIREIQNIYRFEGGRALLRGSGAVLVGCGPAHAFQFCIYGKWLHGKLLLWDRFEKLLDHEFIITVKKKQNLIWKTKKFHTYQTTMQILVEHLVLFAMIFGWIHVKF